VRGGRRCSRVPAAARSNGRASTARWWSPERLTFTVSDQPSDDRYELVIVVLTDLGDGRTEMHFEQRGYMSPEQYDRAKEGWGSFFDRIAERLATA
jgi:hypothetical protein